MVVSPDKFKPHQLLKTFFNLLFQMMIPSQAKIILRKLTKQQPSASLQEMAKSTFVHDSMTIFPNNGCWSTPVHRCHAVLHSLGMSLTLGLLWRQLTGP